MTIRNWDDRPHPRSPAGTLVWPVVVSYAALLAILIIPNDFDYPALLVGFFIYPGMQWACRECRFDPSRPITPLNWALLLFLLQVVVLPLLITFSGPSQGTLPYVASRYSINLSILLIDLSYIAFCMGYQFAASRAGAARAVACPVDPTKSVSYVIANFAIGLIGLWCTFGSVGGLVRYFTEPNEYKYVMEDLVARHATLAEAAGTFLKPFLGFSFIILWCNWADRWGREGSSARRLAITTLLVIPAFLSYATFNYNRGAFIAPLLSITGVYLARVQRVSLVALAGFGSAAFGLIMFLGLYRAGGMEMSELAGDASARQELVKKFKLIDEIQVYGQAPQFLAFVLEQCDYGRDLYWGTTLISSLMLPVPVLGEGFRPTSGPVIFNEMIYGKYGSQDQIIPFQGELFLNFHIPGIAAGYWLLGLLTSRLQVAFNGAIISIDMYILMYVSYWVLFVIQANPAIVSQIFVFFLSPIYLYLATRFLLTRHLRAYSKSGK